MRWWSSSACGDGSDAEAGCLSFQESLFLGFDDRGIGFDGGVGRSVSSGEACLGCGVQLVGLEFEPFGEDVEDLGRRDLGAVLDGRQVGVGDPGKTGEPPPAESEVGPDHFDGVAERFGPCLVVLGGRFEWRAWSQCSTSRSSRMRDLGIVLTPTE